MNITIENILLIGSILLLISIIAGKTSYKFGVPVLVFFLAVGMLAGSEGIGKIYFNDPQIAQFIGVVALNFILFSGGLSTQWSSVKPILWQGVALSTVGVLLTAVSLGTFVWAVTGFTFYEALLLGAIVSSTDAAAVFSILRSKSLSLKSNLRPTLELESGSNDPMAYVLTIVFLGLVMNPEAGFFSIVPVFFKQMLIGGAAGFLFGRLSKSIVNRIQMGFEGLYSVLVIALMFITFSATDVIGGNGFLAVYLSAVYLGNQRIMHKKAILMMFDGLAWLMQIVLFVTLGLLVYPSHILPLLGIGLLISGFMIFVARPLSVIISLIPFKMHRRRRLYIAWVELRGAVPIVFATYPLIAGIDKADTIFNIVFFISLTSVLIQGTTLPILARWLRVAHSRQVKPKGPLEGILDGSVKTDLIEVRMRSDSFAVGHKIIDLDFPKTAIIAMIRRGGNFLIPKGSTTIEEDDELLVLADNEDGIREISSSLKIDDPADIRIR